MLKVIMTKGLPASGKTTWAKTEINSKPNSFKRINKDDLRAMLDNSHWSKDTEKFILKVRDELILLALEEGKHVIVDDTNLAPKHESHIRELIKGKAELVIKDFTDVAIEECLYRDSIRANPVGRNVILGMYDQFLKKVVTYNENENLPRAIIVDLDGTLAKMNNRNPYDWSKVGEDSCNETIKNIVNNYKHTVIVLSGRDSICENETRNWLDKNDIKYDVLYMRPEGNTEKDSIIKRRIFENEIRNFWYIEYVLDDRDQVVRMWREEIGLTCLQVAYGNF